MCSSSPPLTRTIIEAASDLQAETASAATSASFDGLSSVLGGSSEVAPSAHSPTPDLPVTAPANSPQGEGAHPGRAAVLLVISDKE